MPDDIVVSTSAAGPNSSIPNLTRFSLEEVSTLNGSAVTAALVQRIILALRTADGTAVDVTDLASGSKQDTGNTALADILGKLSADPATETTLAAILAKLIAAPSTEAKQDSEITLLTAIASYLDGLATAAETQPVSLASVPSHAVTGAAAATGGYLVATGSIGATKTDIGTANTPGQVGGWYIGNSNSSAVYVQFFNTQASGVTLGTTAPVLSLMIPASSAANLAAGLAGLQFSTAISIAITTTRAGSTGPSSTVDYNIFYKQ